MLSVDALMRCRRSTRSAHHTTGDGSDQCRLVLGHHAGATRKKKTSRGKRKVSLLLHLCLPGESLPRNFSLT
jgi:hypothetical protein